MINQGKSIISVMLITIISRITGFAREISLASVYGATIFTDAYLISTAVPSVIFTGIGMAVESILISMHPKIIHKQGREETDNFMSSLLNLVIVVAAAVSVGTLIFAAPLVRMFAIGFKEGTLKITVEFTRILLPGIIFIGIYYFFTGYLEISKKYEIPTIVKIPNNALIIACIFLSNKRSIYILLFGTLAGLVVQAVILIYYSFKSGFTYKPIINLHDRNIKSAFLLIMPVFIGIAVQQLNVLVDKALASTLIEGSISALNYADKLNSFVQGIIILPIITVVYPTISELAAKEDLNKLNAYIEQSIKIIILLVIPLSAGAMCLSTPIVRVLFQRGNFDDSAVFLTAGSLFYYSIGMIGIGVSSFLAKVFYSMQDTKSPVIISGIAIVMNIILNLVFIKYMHHKGLALATSISSIFGSVLLLYKLKYKLADIGERRILNVIAKACLASALMFVGVRLFHENMIALMRNRHGGESVTLFFSVIFGALIYYLLIVRMKIEEIRRITDLVRNIGRLAE